MLQHLNVPDKIEVPELRRAFVEVEQRHRAYDALVGRLTSPAATPAPTPYIAAAELSATDLFVEKAHIDLQHRASRNRWLAALSAVSAAALIAFIAFMIHDSKLHFPSTSPVGQRDMLSFIFDIVKAIAFDGVLLGLVFFLASLCRAFLHEATLMENRLHSARLGRLYIYLRFAGVRSQAKLNEARFSLQPSELVDVFGWNIETSTAFKDINPKGVASGLVGQVTDLLAQVVDAAKVVRDQAQDSVRKPDANGNGQTTP